MRELSEKAKLPVRTGLVAKSITSPDPGLIAFSITSPGGNEAARRRVMGSWSRGGGRRLYRGEVGCRVELKSFLDRSSITLLIYGPIYLFTRKRNV